MAFTIVEWLDRVLFQVGMEQSEAEKGLYADELAILAGDALVDVGRQVCGDYEYGRPGIPPLAHLFEFAWRFPLTAGGYTGILDTDTKTDTSDVATTRNMLSGTIRSVYHLTGASGETTRTKATKLRSQEDLDKPQMPGLIYWALREGRIETLDTLSRNRYTGNTLTGRLEVHACFIPTLTDFPAREELQALLVQVMLRYARAKRDDRLAAALMKEKVA